MYSASAMHRWIGAKPYPSSAFETILPSISKTTLEAKTFSGVPLFNQRPL